MKTLTATLLTLGTFATATDSAPAPADAFAVQMFSTLAKEQKGNIVFSPASLEAVLRLLKQGARGNTAAELAALPMGKTGIKTTISPKSANALFIDDSLHLSPKIKTDKVFVVPFGENNKEAANIINAWCEKQTKGLIPHILNAKDLSPLTRLVAANAIYLKAKWCSPFATEDTQENAVFTMANGTTTTVDMMFQQEEFRYAEGEDWQAVVLYYQADKRYTPDMQWVGYIGILPKGDAREFAAALTPQKYQDIRKALAEGYPQDTIVYLPRFAVDPGAYSLKSALEACGVTQSFSPAADYRGFAEGLMLSDVLQRCYVKVDEAGTEAAAVTVAMVEEGCYASDEETKPKRIRFDRPFIWVIGDIQSSAAPYFMGLFEKP